MAAGEETEARTFTPGTRSLGKRLVLLVFVTVGCCGLTCLFLGFASWSILKSLYAGRRFRATQGVVIASKVARESGGPRPSYAPL
ncbi:MAG: hypothetical protein ACYTGB_20575, partial [Planctomycetota bacterium]